MTLTLLGLNMVKYLVGTERAKAHACSDTLRQGEARRFPPMERRASAHAYVPARFNSPSRVQIVWYDELDSVCLQETLPTPPWI